MSYFDKEKRQRPYKSPRNTAMSEALTKISDVLKIRSADDTTANIPAGAKEVRQLFTRSVFDIVQDVQAPATAFVIATEKDVSSFWHENLYEDPKTSRTDLMRNLYNLVRYAENTTVGSKIYFGIASIAQVDELRRNAAQNRLKRDRVILEYIQATGMFIELENVGTAVATFRNRKGDWVKGVQTYVMDRPLASDEAVGLIISRIEEKDARLSVEEKQAAHLAELRQQERIDKEFNQPLRNVLTDDGKVLPKNIINNVRRLLNQEKINISGCEVFINRLISYLQTLDTAAQPIDVTVDGNMVSMFFPNQQLSVRFYFSYNEEKRRVEHRVSTRRIRTEKAAGDNGADTKPTAEPVETEEEEAEEGGDVSDGVKEALSDLLEVRVAEAVESILATGDEEAPVLALEDQPAAVARLVHDAYLNDEAVGEGSVGFITPKGTTEASTTDLFIIHHDLPAVLEVSFFANDLEGKVDYSVVFRPLAHSTMVEEADVETTEADTGAVEAVEEVVDALVEPLVKEEKANESERDTTVSESAGE